VPHHYVVPTLLGVGLLAGLLLSATWATLIGVGTLYLVNLPVSLYAYRRLRLAHEARMRAVAEDPEARMQSATAETVAPDPPERDEGLAKSSSFERRPPEFPGGRPSG